MDLSRSEVLDKAEAALALQPIEDPVSVIEVRLALRALITEHRRVLAELDEAHAHFQVQEARIREARRVDDATEWEYGVRDSKGGRIWKTTTAGARPGDVAVRRRKAGPWERIEGAVMSTCISREGEYSEHELAEKPEFMCSRCFAFDEDAAVAEVARLRALLAAQAPTPDVEALARVLDENDPDGGVFPDEGDTVATYWFPQARAVLSWLHETGYRKEGRA